jgi:hypothetical protein
MHDPLRSRIPAINQTSFTSAQVKQTMIASPCLVETTD